MLYVIHKGNHPELTYHNGQEPILHLKADLHKTVVWADRNEQRWAFTAFNAKSFYFEDQLGPYLAGPSRLGCNTSH